jgi:FkbM family methyltransferase
MSLKGLVRKAFHRAGYDIVRAPGSPSPLLPVERSFLDLLGFLIEKLYKPSEELRLVQVGAHDGQSYDPLNHVIRRQKTSGVLVEPQQRAFRKLRDAYSDVPGLHFENCAISDSDGHLDFFKIRDDAPDLPIWLDQSASLDREVLSNALKYFRDAKGVRAIPSDHESLIEVRRAPTMTWANLLEKHQIFDLDLLVIDTMGHDCKLIELFPFQRLKPRIIHFEHSLAPGHELKACLDLLERNGYSLAKVAVDTIACLDVPARKWTVAGW